MTLNEVKELIELVAEKGFAEFEVEHSGFKLKIVATGSSGRRAFDTTPATAGGGDAPASPLEAAGVLPEASLPAPQHAAAEPAAEPAAELHVVKSPIVGTFYRAASPTSEPFVKVGDLVEAGAVLCIIEAMKLMNEIETEQAGEIAKIFVENGQPVEFGQPLFGIRA